MFYKVALNENNTIQLEYDNFESIGKRYPALLSVLPDYKIGLAGSSKYLSMTRYSPIEVKTGLEYAKGILKLMRMCGLPNKRLEILESEQLEAGLEAVQRLYGDSTSQVVREIIQTYLRDGQYHIGFVHGDFHFRNILADDLGCPRLVDLDCVRLQGIQELDAMSLLLEMEWSETGRLWYESILSYFKGDIPDKAEAFLSDIGVKFSSGLGATYFIDRIGQESAIFEFNYSRKQLDKVIQEILSCRSDLPNHVSKIVN